MTSAAGKLQGNLRAAMQQARQQAMKTTGGVVPVVADAAALSLDALVLPARQPRRYFDTDGMRDLVASIRQHGVLQPILVRRLASGEYELVAGERRYRAAKEAGLREIPVVIKSLTDSEAATCALLENLQREGLNPVDETEGILQLLALQLEKSVPEVTALLHRMQNEHGGKVTQNVLGSSEADAIREVFDRLGRLQWSSFVTTRLPLLNLPDNILTALRSGVIAYTKAREIARLPNADLRTRMLEEVTQGNLPLAQIRARIAAQMPKPTRNLGPNGTADVDLSLRLAQLAKRFKKHATSPDDDRRAQAQGLLDQLEALLFGAPPTHLLEPGERPRKPTSKPQRSRQTATLY